MRFTAFFLGVRTISLATVYYDAFISFAYYTYSMAYSIYGPTSCRQKIELGILGLSAIKPRCSVYLAACPAYVGTNISFGRNYWGKYGPFVLFAISVNKSVAFIFLVTYFLQHIYMYSSSTLVNLQAIYSTRSLVIGVYTGKPFNVFSK